MQVSLFSFRLVPYGLHCTGRSYCFFLPECNEYCWRVSTDNIGDSLQIYVENKKEQSNIAILNAYRITNC